MSEWDRLVGHVDGVRAEVLGHPVYYALGRDDALRTFMEHHVWAVWDFMSMLVRLQRDLTCVEVPWLPPVTDTEVVRFVNEIKVGEESDRIGTRVVSHLDLYLEAMEEVGADPHSIRATIGWLRAGSVDSPVNAARKAGAPAGALRFLETTFGIIGAGTTVEVAAAFALGRETLIPAMFEPIIERTQARALRVYLRRHVEIDGGEHGPVTHRMVRLLCGDDDHAWASARRAAMAAISARRRLWDDTLAAITNGANP